MKSFMSLFRFDQSKTLHVGVEREYFITDKQGVIIPKAHQVLAQAILVGPPGPGGEILSPDESFGYELSACQIESRIGPCRLENLMSHLIKARGSLTIYLSQAGFNCDTYEVAPADMPLDVYPDPSGRYQKITKDMPRHILLAACRVIGTHIHIGMPDHSTALKVYNQVIKQYDRLCTLGNGSFGERLDIYKTVAPDCDPPPYENWTEFYKYAQAKGFDQDPRKCWTLIRISKHGTIEFRMFGATSSLDRIVSWAALCHRLCNEALAQ